MSVMGMSVGLSSLHISSAPVANGEEATITAATFAEIKGNETFPDIGDEAEVVTFDTIEDNRQHKLAGVKDAGDVEFVVVYDLDDEGQSVAREAANTNELHAFKVTLPNKTSIVFAGIVTSARQSFGGTSDVIKNTIAVAITSGVYFVPAPSA